MSAVWLTVGEGRRNDRRETVSEARAWRKESKAV